MRIGGVATHANTSDILTKNLQPPLHQKHTRELNITQENHSNRQTLSNNVLSLGSRHTPKHNEDMHDLPLAFNDLIFRSNHTQRKKVPLPHPLATCAHIQHKNVEKPHKNTQHRRRAKKTRQIRQTTGPPAHTKQIQTRRPNRSANHPPAPPYTNQDKTRPHGTTTPPSKNINTRMRNKRGRRKRGRIKCKQDKHDETISFLTILKTSLKSVINTKDLKKFWHQPKSIQHAILFSDV